MEHQRQRRLCSVDLRQPLYWPKWKKVATVFVLACGAFVSSLGLSILAPALALILDEFDEADETVGVFAISVYALGMALSPFFVSGISETVGRAPVLHVCNVAFVGFSVGTALSPSVRALIAFRLLSGIVGSVSITIAVGSISDVFPPEQHARATGVYGLGQTFGPVLAPIIGGHVAQALGWRWACWILAIIGGAFTLVALFLFRETWTPRQANTGRVTTLLRAAIRPVRMIGTPTVLLPCCAVALAFGVFVLVLTTMATLFQRTYSFSAGNSGLVYLGVGCGQLVGLITLGTASDRAYKRASRERPPELEIRLYPMLLAAPLMSAGMAWYGWSLERGAHWIVPVLGSSMVGCGMVGFILPATTYLMEVGGRDYAASTVAASISFRSIWGVVIPLAAFQLYDHVGLGWGNTLLGLLVLLNVGVSWALARYGRAWREKFPVTG